MRFALTFALRQFPVAPNPPLATARISVTSCQGHARGRQDDGLREAIATCDVHLRGRNIQDLHDHLVIRAGIVGIDHAHAVGNHESALERRAASGENTKEVTVGTVGSLGDPTSQ